MKNIEEVKVLKGHENRIETLAFSPDGKWLATGSFDGLRLWNVQNPREVFKDQAEPIDALAFSPDGKWLAAGSYRTVRLWNMENTEQVKVLKGHEGSVYALAFTSDGKWLASSHDGPVRLWNMENPEEVKTLKGHQASIVKPALAFSIDDKWLVVKQAGCNRLWNMENEKDEWCGAELAFSPDGKWLATVTNTTNTVNLWSLQQIHELAKNLKYPQLMLLLKLAQMEAPLVLSNDYFHSLYHSITDPKLKKAINLYFPFLCSRSSWWCSILRSSTRTKIIATSALAAAGIGVSAYCWLKNNKSGF